MARELFMCSTALCFLLWLNLSLILLPSSSTFKGLRNDPGLPLVLQDTLPLLPAHWQP